MGVRDAGNIGNTATDSVMIGQPAPTPVALSCSKSDVTVYGGKNGSITVTASGGNSGSYEYSINGGNWQSSNTFGSLGTGTYTVGVRDAGNISNTATAPAITIGQPAPTPVALTCSKSDVTVYGGKNGSITVTASGGNSGSYEYSINGGNWQSSNTFGSLGVGTYTVEVRDAENINNTATDSVIMIGQPAPTPVALTCSKSDVTVYGGKNGSITVTASGGNSGAYEYSLNGGNWQFSNTFGSLETGTYTVGVRDAGNIGNTATDSVMIGQPAPTPVALSCSKSDVTVYSGKNGSITVTASGGNSGAYEYSLNGGNWQSSDTFGSLGTGTYTVAVRDAGNISNTATDSVTIGQPAPTPVALTCSKSDVTVYGGTNGSIAVTASGGNSGAYEYSLNGGNWQSSDTFGSLGTGTYTVAVRDAGNISNVATASMSIGQPSYMGSFPTNKVPTQANVGKAFTVSPQKAPTGFTLQSVSYSSSSNSVATVYPSGNVTFIAGGKATIIITMVFQKVDNKGKVITKKVTVKKTITVLQPVSSITLSQPGYSVLRTKTVKVLPIILPNTASNKKVKWSSSDAKVASVSSSGVVTGKKAGSVIITCTALDGSKVSASCTVTVMPISAQSIKLSKTTLTVKTGKTGALIATVKPSNSDFIKVTWASSDPSIASVDIKTGKIKGVAPGTVTITATTADRKRASCIVTIN